MRRKKLPFEFKLVRELRDRTSVNPQQRRIATPRDKIGRLCHKAVDHRPVFALEADLLDRAQLYSSKPFLVLMSELSTLAPVERKDLARRRRSAGQDRNLVCI